MMTNDPTTRLPITPAQKAVFDFMESFALENGVLPSTREIQHAFGWSSQTSAMKKIRSLEKANWIVRIPGKARAATIGNPLKSQISAILASKQTMTAKLAEIAELVK
jgi:SOS-response transcriptional repressor LexA